MFHYCTINVKCNYLEIIDYYCVVVLYYHIIEKKQPIEN